MGSDFRSFCIRRGDRDEIAATVRRWLETRGFEVLVGRELLELDEEHERGARLYWNDDWAVLLYSHFEEEERLQLELQRLDRPVLYLWLHDSDIWGYELTENGQELSSFHSNPRYFGATEKPGSPNDPALLLAKLGLANLRPEEILGLQAKRGLFKENACLAFARALGAGPGASQYSYALEEPPPADGDSFQHHTWRFRRPDFDPLEGFDLHALRARRVEQPSPPAQNRPPLSLVILRGIFRLLFLPFKIFVRIRHATQRAQMRPDNWSELGLIEEEGFLLDTTRFFRLRKVDGLAPSPGTGRLPVAIQGTPLWFQALDGQTAHARITRNRDRILDEEDLQVGSWPAKRVRTVTSGGDERRWSESYYLATPQAVLFFNWRTTDEEHEQGFQTLREMVESLELLDNGAT